MTESRQQYPISPEPNDKIGLRLQDVILHAGTTDSEIMTIRKSVREYMALHPEASERNAVLNALSLTLLHQDLNQTLAAARTILKPHRRNGPSRPGLIISSASPSSGSQETEKAVMSSRGRPIDIPGAIEGRDIRSALPGDTALISTPAGLRMAASQPEIKIIDLANAPILTLDNGSTLFGRHIYYKSDALLLAEILHPQSDIIRSLIREIRSDRLICPYNLDEETQVALVWLAGQAGVASLEVNANSPEVATNLTRKGYRYPPASEALQIPYTPDPVDMQYREWKLSQSALEINHRPDIVPGYVIPRNSSQTEMARQAMVSFMLLSARYNLTSAWTKPDRGTDGGNQAAVPIDVPGTVRTRINTLLEKGRSDEAIDTYASSLTSPELVSDRINRMWESGGDWVCEAETRYFTISIPLGNGLKPISIDTKPSVHIIKGRPRYTISLQLTDGEAWGGNLICSETTWNRLLGHLEPDSRTEKYPHLKSDLRTAYGLMVQAMCSYVSSVNSSGKYQDGQVRGGADLALATLGGKFGHDRLVIAVQDYNARANGCETAYALYDQAQIHYGNEGEAVTRNFSPLTDFDTVNSRLSEAVLRVNSEHSRHIEPARLKLLAVSYGWGQIGLMGTDAVGILQDIFLLERQLRIMKIIL